MKLMTMLTIEEVRRKIDLYKPSIVMDYTGLSYGALYSIKSGRDVKYSTVKRLSDFILSQDNY